uniref:hypothetical protein n=1 Tax=Thaumasiovibrio occultus TaxID=1891184 RepID=UPI000B35A559|nr:hypothetical protein [Thaumasiovibrio occultus]
MGWIAKNSSWLLFVAAGVGFVFPALSALIFPWLPAILFFLMLFTLTGMEQSQVLRYLGQASTWKYALLHGIALPLLLWLGATLFGASADMTLALIAVGVTGSLFATPAIVRSLGLDAIPSAATTIASTLIMPLALFVFLLILQGDGISLDLTTYFARLLIFIIMPMGISALLYRYVPAPQLQQYHQRIAHFPIVLVFAFPLGLVGQFRSAFDDSIGQGLGYLALAFVICGVFFLVALGFYWSHGIAAALTAAITSGNRNVLLTWTVAGSYLGSEYLFLIGALQIPIYLQPLLIRQLYRKPSYAEN